VEGVKAFPTALETYRNCPRKYAFDRDPDIKREYRKPTQALFVGSCVHDALEWFFDTSITRVEDRNHETLVQLLRDAWGGKRLTGRRAAQRRAERREVFGADRATEAAAGEKAKHMLWGFCRTQDLAAVPFTTEVFHEAPLGGGHVLAGKIDRIDRRPDDTLAVVDYKTGKSKTVENLRAEDLQLACYAIVAGRRFKVPISRCSMIYLKESREVGFEPDPAWLEAKEAEIRGLMDAIDREDALPAGPERFPPTPNPLCGWCDYRPLCPEGRDHLAREAARAGAPSEGDEEEPPF